jgi:aromatic-L-amino-acid decarboxylase
MESVGERRVTPDVEPGYLRDLIPKKAPNDGEGWADIMSDVETKIMPGVSETLFLICFFGCPIQLLLV